MKKIIREMLDDLKPKTAPAADDIAKGLQNFYGPQTQEVLPAHQHNEGQIVVQDGQPHGPNIETLHLDAKVLPPTPNDLNAQILSDDPAERVRQLDFQAQKSEERQRS